VRVLTARRMRMPGLRKPREEGVVQHVRRRARGWLDGDIDALIHELLATAPLANPPPRLLDKASAALATRILHKVADGPFIGSSLHWMLEPTIVEMPLVVVVGRYTCPRPQRVAWRLS
jgi:hypothetical protein